ncbi:amidohydrolase, partial [Candidatus Bathyarchaeota archaeon]|nr:amidohydrolase [Candidatus Bathyarchaeota archaeon]
NGTSIGHKSTVFATKVMAGTVIDLLSNPELVKEAKAEWERQMDGRLYKSPIPTGVKPPLDQLKKH